jgi:hypothetical protein
MGALEALVAVNTRHPTHNF